MKVFPISFIERTFSAEALKNRGYFSSREVFPPCSEIKKKYFQKLPFHRFYEQRSLSSNIFRHLSPLFYRKPARCTILKIYFFFSFFCIKFFILFTLQLCCLRYFTSTYRGVAEKENPSFPPYSAKFPGQLNSELCWDGRSIEIWTEQRPKGHPISM